MPATERYQADVFAIVVLITSVLIIVFLIITAIYFFNLMSLKPPSKAESTFLFWTSIVLVLIFLGITIFSLIHIFSHKSVVYEEPKSLVTPKREVVATPPPIAPPAPVPAPVAIQTTPSPVKISNVPKSARATNESVSLSDIPVTQTQRNTLDQELLSLGDITGGP
jgi:predicted membrane protein